MSTISDAVDCIALESVAGIDSASGTVGDAQQSAALLAPAPQGSLTHSIESLGLCWGAREEFPRALALQRALCQALVARGPQQAATSITEAAFERVGGPRQARHVIAGKQTGPRAPADLVEVTAKCL